MIRALDRVRYWLMCGAGRHAPGRWSFRLESYDGGLRIAVEDDEPGAHADQLALLSLVLGLEAIDELAEVTVLTPNRYIWQGLSEGLDEWRENGWQWEAFGGLVPIKYVELWQRVDRLRTIHDITCRAIPLGAIAANTTFSLPELAPADTRPARNRMRRIHLPVASDWPTHAPQRRRAAAREPQPA